MAGRLPAVCALILILGAIGCSDAQPVIDFYFGCPAPRYANNPDFCARATFLICKDQNHPGVCPRPQYAKNPEFCATARFAICGHDSQCKNHEKCCSNGCARVCTSVIQDHPGVCPRPQYAKNPEFCARARFAICGHDSQCKRHEKCCYNGCARVCTPVIQDHPGVCPRPQYAKNPEFCATARFATCSDDSQCKRHEKCCSNGCARVCTPVIQDRPGVCPRPQYAKNKDFCATARFAICAHDSQCKKHEKCCYNGCARVCTSVFQDHPGACPRPTYCGNPRICPAVIFPSCSHDSQCKEHEKCCDNGCARVCMSAEKVKPGKCPMYHLRRRVCPLNVRPECLSDYDCPWSHKCCRDNCGPRCVKPLGVKDGACPKYDRNEQLRPNEKWRECYNDCDCPGAEKCCRRGCISMCALPVKPGQCPRFNHYENVWCPRQRQCSNDFECPRDWKCCKKRCGQVCTPPYQMYFRG
ncbi:balbiani ring protein 3-like [Salarias fasciatus]|uniref:balbiani ring protein 3-like n=1 Tax=Salarias fasciatus TaxID=181472 RepID=UPI001176DFAD|nr:balbiani ring protein 3-like [Salarias fasciatus]